jgi:DNA helicase-2/ATP-dependent DNA helicase PcrA
MAFHADLHVHSKHSRATSRDLDLEHLAWWAARKGIAVVGTGDCVHPAWLAEIKDKLVPAGNGLFALRGEIEAEIRKTLPPSCRNPVRFMLSVEISTIYKKAERTRKIHHLIYVPDFAAADRLAASLARIGDIASDGRPILGLDSRDLLEIALESGPHSYLVPAHIWTPWFAALGSQSGFDSIAECYGDLADRIFAVETGLSSDPAMNWRVSFLDRYRLTSNSDAHSPGKLGREATRFSCEPDFFAIRRALETGDGYEGTVEFFPEEGKYHLDGHRACGVRLDPAETIAHEGRCPVCGSRVTFGVAHRVEMLADRKEALRPPTAGAVTNLVPLPEILAEIAGGGVASQGVTRAYDRTTAALGSELSVLAAVPVEDIGRLNPLLGEAVGRLRAGAVSRQAGYDGEYGVIRLFKEGELDRLTGGDLLFEAPTRRRARAGNRAAPERGEAQEAAAVPLPAPDPPAPTGGSDAAPPLPLPACGERVGERGPLPNLELASQSRRRGPLTRNLRGERANSDLSPQTGRGEGHATCDYPAPAGEGGQGVRRAGILAALDADQARAAEATDGPLIVMAGPGSGKTRMLTHRLAHLVLERGVPAASCLAVTFTRRAAEELRGRLAALLPRTAGACAVHSFHSLGLAILRASGGAASLKPDFRIAGQPERSAALARALSVTDSKAAQLLKAVSLMKRTGREPEDADAALALATCRRLGREQNWVDFDDLVALSVAILETDAQAAAGWQNRFCYICVDEFQDVDEQQYRLLRRLAPADSNICVIGDPNQAIYGFRGATAACFARFQQDFPSARTMRLGRNYRSTGAIVTAAAQVIGGGAPEDITRPMQDPVIVHAASTEQAEAEFVTATIESLLGGNDLLAANREQFLKASGRPLGFADFAVLYRTGAQSSALREAFDKAGVPFKKSSPAPIAGQPMVRALLAALEQQGAGLRALDLSARIAAAAQHLRQDGEGEDIAALAEAKRWLTALAITAPSHGSSAGTLGEEALLREQVALSTEADFWDARADRVSLLTMHAAKGLEFPVVFVVGLEDGLVPFSWGACGGSDVSGAPHESENKNSFAGPNCRTNFHPQGSTPPAGNSGASGAEDLSDEGGSDAEERRLFYVAMTRAKDRLFLSRAQRRAWRGQLRTLPPSPYLRDIPAELVLHHTAPARKERRGGLQYSLF